MGGSESKKEKTKKAKSVGQTNNEPQDKVEVVTVTEGERYH